MSHLVQKGNTIHVPAEFLGGEKAEKIDVSWSQMLKTRHQEYYVCKYAVRSGGNADGVVFVQADKVDEFKSKKVDGEDFTVTVDESFQYGQNKGQTRRFLVFHDTNNKPFQHRFVENLFTKIGGAATKFAEPLGLPANQVGEFAKSFLGDYLHNY